MRTVIVIVDGIDEAGDLRELIVKLILQQLFERGHSLVATSRPEGVQNAEGKFANAELENFTILDLEPLTEDQQDRAIKTQLREKVHVGYENLAGFSQVVRKLPYLMIVC